MGWCTKGCGLDLAVSNGDMFHPSIHAESMPGGTRDGPTSPQLLFLGPQAAACYIASRTCLQSLAEALGEADMLREAMRAAAERIQSAQASQEGAEQAAETVKAEAAELRKQVARLQGEVSVLSQEQVRARGAPWGACESRGNRWAILRPHLTGALPAGVGQQPHAKPETGCHGRIRP